LRVGVIGVGAVGTRAARQLVSSDDVDRVVLREHQRERLTEVVASMGSKTVPDQGAWSDPLDVDVAVLAGPAGSHAAAARALLERGVPVVSTSDDIGDVRALLDLDAEARERSLAVAVGAGFGPGLSCVLAMHAASRVDAVDEVHVARVGTGGPACARHHHHVLARPAIDWRDGAWISRPGGSGRELCWFPDPIGGQDCYRAALPDALLLVPALSGVQRVTARVGATRRDRLTARLPMLWPTHPEGGPGAIRVEVRGRRGTGRDVVVYGVIDRPAVAAGAVAATAALAVARGEVSRVGAGGLAELVEPVPFLAELKRRGVRAAAFQPAASAGD
jgi:hypothetical protein